MLWSEGHWHLVMTTTQEGRRRPNRPGWPVGSYEAADRCLGPKGFKLRLQLKQNLGVGGAQGCYREGLSWAFHIQSSCVLWTL